MKRIGFIDGLKGVAALLVVFHHFALAYFPATYSGDMREAHLPWQADWILFKTPLNLLVSGNYALAIFLILSGFSLSLKYFTSKNPQDLKRLAYSRYWRLLPPIVLGNLFALGLIPLSRMAIQQAAQITGSWWWLQKTWNFEPQILIFLKQTLIDIFIKNLPQDVAYNTSLWIIPIFFLGTFLVVLYLLLFGRFKWRGLVLALLIWVFGKSYYLPLLIGVAIADLYVNFKQFRLPPGLGYLGLGVSLWLCSYPNQFTEGKLDGTLYEFLPLVEFNYTPTFYHILGATGLVGFLFGLPKAQGWLEKPIPQFLSRISYPMFIFHAVVLAGVSTPLFVGFKSVLPYNLSFSLMMISVMTLIIGSAWAYNRYIEPKLK